jgi:hypothetical protein
MGETALIAALTVPAFNLILDLADWLVWNPMNAKNTNTTSSIIEIPIVYSSDISIDAINGYCKYQEVLHAYTIKAVVEGITRTRFDSDMKSIYRQLPVRTSMDQTFLEGMGKFAKSLFEGKNSAKVDKYLAAFSESCRGVLRNEGLESEYLTIESIQVANDSVDKILSGEAMEAIYNDSRAALPTFITANVTVNNSGKSYNKTITLGISCPAKMVSPEEMIGFFLENKYEAMIKGTNLSTKEKNSWRLFQTNAIATKNRMESTPEGKVLVNKMSKLFGKIKTSTKPFVGILMSNFVEDYLTAKNFSIYTMNQYSKLMDKFPIDNIGVYDTNTDIVSYSVGPLPRFERRTATEIKAELSEYMKEVRNVIQYNKYN